MSASSAILLSEPPEQTEHTPTSHRKRRLRPLAGGGQASSSDDEGDSALVERAQSGDDGAFTSLMLRHERRAFAIAFGLVKDENDAREIVQEAFLRVHRGLRDFQGSATFFTWLYRIVTNLSIDLMRRPQRRETEPLEVLQLEQATGVPGLAHVDSDPLEVLWHKEVIERIASSVSQLPPYHRGVIMMRELDGLSYEQMAVEMGVSKGTIMSRLFHARQKLQRSLGGVYAEQFGTHRTRRPAGGGLIR